MDSGFIIPSINKDGISCFKFSFKVKRNSGNSASYYYKIYYQNKSYKFNEVKQLDGKQVYNPLCEENFYGSWENVAVGFKPLSMLNGSGTVAVEDSFRIVGNPKSDSIFFGHIPNSKYASETRIEGLVSYIKTDEAWYNNIKSKAAENKITVEQQLRLDAKFAILDERKKEIHNQRWKCNPRVGTYEFMVVVASEEALKNIPKHVANINLKLNGSYTNPFYFFNYGPGKNSNGVQVLKSISSVSLFANPELSKGIYVDEEEFNNREFCNENLTPLCNFDSASFTNAVFSQYRHKQIATANSKNVPLTINWQTDSFTVKNYRELVSNYTSDKMKLNTVVSPMCPCKTVRAIPERKSIQLVNPLNKTNEGVKENTGIISRHGFTYGKFTIKLMLPNQLSKFGVWNGLTNAIWLINQENKPWNNRRKTEKSGYIPKEIQGRENAKRVAQTPYTEIDFEIRKASLRWPQTSYKPPQVRPKEIENENTLMLSCTNWDLASTDVEKYVVGVSPIAYNNQVFDVHRWDNWYQALTSKYPVSDSVIFGKPYYFQIEWKPQEIIWRIGPSVDALQIVGYMSDKITSIPNNQMVMVITQEFHQSEWWPESPFLQEYIPFNGNDLKGEVLEIVIE